MEMETAYLCDGSSIDHVYKAQVRCPTAATGSPGDLSTLPALSKVIYYNTANLLLLLEEEKLTATRYLLLEMAYHHLAAGWGASRPAPVSSLSALLPQGTSANVAERDLGPLTTKDF